MPSFARSNPSSAGHSDGSGRHDDLPPAGRAARILLAAIRVYQVMLSPLFSGSCRYVPSCSAYMAEAVRVHGAGRGAWLGLKRLSRCHPLGSSGFDPVPGRGSRNAHTGRETTNPGPAGPGLTSPR